jgi:hypothetical protein
MKNLTYLHFEDCLDGDISPLLHSKSLEEFNFATNRKKYSHTFEEIKKLRMQQNETT